jgi:hypothetical protein
MKKMNKMYEAPKAEVVELNVNKGFMIDDSAWSTLSVGQETGSDL